MGNHAGIRTFADLPARSVGLRRSSADGALAPAQSGAAASRLLSATPPRSARLSEEETDRWGEEGGVCGRLVKMLDKLKCVAHC